MNSLNKTKKELMADIEKLTRRINELNESENRCRLLVQNIDEIIYMMDTTTDPFKGHVNFISDQTEKIIGYRPQEFIENPLLWFQITHPEDVPVLIEDIKKIVTLKKSLTRFYRLKVKHSDEYRWFEDKVVPQYDKKENIIGFFGVARDITEYKKTEKKIRESELKYRSLVEMASLAIAIHSEGKVVFINKAGLKLIGAKASNQVLGKPISQFVHPDVWDETRMRIKRMMEGKKEVYPVESRYVQIDGSIINVEVTASLLVFEGKPAVQIIVRDITARKQVEQKLKLSDEILDQINAIVLVADSKGEIIYANPGVKSILGYQVKEVLGDGWWRLPGTNIKQRQEEKSRMAKIATGKIPLKQKPYERLIRNKKGQDKWIFWHDSANITGYVIGVGYDITAEKKAKDALVDSEVRYRALFESAGDSIFIMKGEKFIDCNSKTLELFGCKRHQIIGQTPYKFSPNRQPDGRASREKAREKIKAALTGKLQFFEWQHKKYNGTLFYAEITLNKVDIGRETFIQAIVRDITDRKEAEEALRESEEKLKTVVNHAPVILWSINKDGIFTFSEGFGLKALKLQPGEVVGKSVYDIYKHNAQIIQDTERALNGESINSISIEGDIVYDTRFAPLYDENNKVTGMIGVATDITERVNAEKALQESERRYKMATNAGGVGVWDWNLETNEIYIDPILKMILGYDDHEIENQLDVWGNLVHPDDRKMVMDQAEAHIKGRSPRYEVKHRMMHRDGSVRWFQTRGTVLYNIKDHPFRMVGTDTDITKQMQAELEKATIESQLIKAQKMEAVGTLAGGIAHDFNNLLTTIQGYTDISLSQLKEGEGLYRYLKQIHRATKRAANLTNQLLLFSRKQLIEPASININETIQNVLQLLERIIGEDIRIETKFETKVWKIWADMGNMEQMIMNLLVNSRDAMPKGGMITIQSENVNLTETESKKMPGARPGRFVCLTFNDSGVGMSEKVLQHIFEPFFTTKEMGKGTGLGLSVVYGIIQQHKGWLSVHSKVAEGTEFKVYLPASFIKQQVVKKEELSLREYHGKGEVILLVEDEEDILDFAAGILGEYGYKVLKAVSLKHALEVYHKNVSDIDVVFSDVVLPDGNGLNLVEILREKRPNLPVLLTSGYTGDKTNWNKIQEKGYRFLKKPFALLELLKAIRRSLEE